MSLGSVKQRLAKMKLLVTALLLLPFITWSVGQDRPTIARTQASSPTSITLQWSQIQLKSLAHYEIRYTYIGPCDGIKDSGTMLVQVPVPVTEYIEHNLTDLQEFSSYRIAVNAVYLAEAGTETTITITTTTVTTLQTAPSAGPEHLKTTGVGPTTISIQWGEVSCVERNSQIIRYQVHYRNQIVGDDLIIGSVERMTTLKGLAPLTDYLIQVAAIGNTGSGSVTFSEPLVVQTLPPIPGPVTSLGADSRVTSVTLTWAAPSNGTVTEYQVDYYLAEANELVDSDYYGVAEADAQGHITHIKDTSVEITELWPGTTYSVVVRATNDAGVGNAVAIQATTEDIPRVMNVQASADPLNDTEVTVTWSSLRADSVPLELLTYIVYYNILSSTECPLDVALQEYYPSDVTSVTVSDLERDQLYVFQVAAGVEVGGEFFMGERSLLNEDSIARTGGSDRCSDEGSCSDEEECSDGVNYGPLIAIGVGTFIVTALLFIIIAVATSICWRRKQRSGIDKAKIIPQRQPSSANRILLKECAAYGVSELHAVEDIDTSTTSYSYVDIENTYEN